MNIFATILLMTIAQLVGCYLLNDQGGLTKNGKAKALGLIASVLSAYFAVAYFGSPSGLFVYFGFLSVIGMLFAMLGAARRTPG